MLGPVAGCGDDDLTPASIVRDWRFDGPQYRVAQQLVERDALIGLSERQVRVLLAGAEVSDRYVRGNDRVKVLFWAKSCSGRVDCFNLLVTLVNDRIVSSEYRSLG